MRLLTRCLSFRLTANPDGNHFEEEERQRQLTLAGLQARSNDPLSAGGGDGGAPKPSAGSVIGGMFGGIFGATKSR